MPNPKRRHSQKRTATRRAHDSLSKHSLSECPNCHEQKMPHRACPKHSLSECPNCHEQKMPHRACPKCGTYKGREVIEVAEKS